MPASPRDSSDPAVLDRGRATDGDSFTITDLAAQFGVTPRAIRFSLAEIRELLDLYDAGDGGVRQRERTLEACGRRIAALVEQRNDIDATIEELENFVAVVEGLQSTATAEE
jgi:DNA-binding transcriptional MerR regulator